MRAGSFVFIHSVIFIYDFTMVRCVEDPETILGILGVMWEHRRTFRLASDLGTWEETRVNELF